jgi:ABC-type multidrug transport system permease subunit
MTPLTVFATAWVGCVLLAVAVFCRQDIRNNRAHGWFGWAHTAARMPLVAVVAPLYLWMAFRSTRRPDRG